MAERFDVIIVGARCAGSPLAILLARAGLRVCVLDRARFPSDTASTHGVQPSGVKILDHLGVLEPLLKVTPAIERGILAFDDARVEVSSRADAVAADRIRREPIARSMLGPAVRTLRACCGGRRTRACRGAGL